MSAATHHFERAVRSSYDWLDTIAARLNGERRDAYRALHAVLGALRDRLPVDVAVNLSAQMPLLVRGIFFDDEPAHKPLSVRTAGDFAAAVAAALMSAPRIDARDATDAVLEVLTANLDQGELQKIQHRLPAELRAYLGPHSRALAAPRAEETLRA